MIDHPIRGSSVMDITMIKFLSFSWKMFHSVYNNCNNNNCKMRLMLVRIAISFRKEMHLNLASLMQTGFSNNIVLFICNNYLWNPVVINHILIVLIMIVLSRIISLISIATWLQDLNINFKLKCTKLNSSYIHTPAADKYEWSMKGF